MKCLELNNNSEYRVYYEKVKTLVDELSQKSSTDFFTIHDSTHCLAIEKIVDMLLSKCKSFSLTDLEKFLLLVSIWSHDLGMFDAIAKEYFTEMGVTNSYTNQKRKIHEEISAWYLSKKYETIFFKTINKNFEDQIMKRDLKVCIDIVNQLIKFHRRSTKIDNCPECIYFNDEIVRTRVLACILRLGDTLHIDYSRFNKELYDILQIGDFDRSARLHWLKSYVVQNVFLDADNQTVYINIGLPELKDEKYENEWEDEIKKLEFIIKTDIHEDIVAVSETFRKYSLPVYLIVKTNTNQIPGFDKNMREEILGILNDIDIIFSPNSSKIIKKALDSISSLSRMKFDDDEKFYKHLKQLIDHLKKIHEDRPCHVGLLKIITELDTINIPATKDKIKLIDEDKNKLSKYVDNIKKMRGDAEQTILDTASKGEYLKEINNIFVLGYSDMVMNFLKGYYKIKAELKDNVHIYVIEGGSKRRYSVDNVLEYSDGIHYAIQLSKYGFSKVNIIPDVTFASILNLGKYTNDGCKKSNSIVLLGANGIDFDKGSCGHSSGHLAVATTAKYFEIPVIVIADTFKTGKIIWNLSAERNTDWLTTQKNYLDEIKEMNIHLLNYREDEIPKDLITAILSEKTTAEEYHLLLKNSTNNIIKVSH